MSNLINMSNLFKKLIYLLDQNKIKNFLTSNENLNLKSVLSLKFEVGTIASSTHTKLTNTFLCKSQQNFKQNPPNHEQCNNKNKTPLECDMQKFKSIYLYNDKNNTSTFKIFFPKIF